VDARASKVAVTPFHTDANGTPDTVPAGTQWFESYLESTDGGASFSAPETVDPTPAKTGPVCTEGTGCSADRDLGDFQAVALDPQDRANATWTHVIAKGSDSEVRVAATAPRKGLQNALVVGFSAGKRAVCPAARRGAVGTGGKPREDLSQERDLSVAQPLEEQSLDAGQVRGLGVPAQLQPRGGQMSLDGSAIGVNRAPLDQAASFK
jgi:hypothetical protein